MSTRTRAVQRIERRRDYLLARVATKRDRGGGDESDSNYDLAEIAALEFALGVLEDAVAIGIPNLGDLTLADRQRLRALLEGEGQTT